MASTIWAATGVTPAATDRLPVDVGAAGAPSRWTGQQVADIRSYVGGTVNALGSVGTNQSVSLADGRYISATITGNVQFTFTSVPSGATDILLQLTNGGAHTVSFAATVNWSGGTTPSLQSSGTDLIRLYTTDGGTNFIGELANDEQVTAATSSAAGIVELAIASEVSTGTDSARAMTVDSYKKSTPFYNDRSADWTLALTDVNVDQWFNNGASALVCTIPLNATVAFAVGDTIPFVRLASGTATIDAATSVTLNGVSGGSCTIQTQYQGALLKKIGTDSWVVSGDVSAVA